MPSTRAQSSKEAHQDTVHTKAEEKPNSGKHGSGNGEPASIGQGTEKSESTKKDVKIVPSVPHKRKTSETDKGATSPPPAKAARQSPSPKAEADEAGSSPTASQVLHFLLSDASLPYTVPESEASAPKEVRIYASARLSAFEELLAAVVLSRPISHRLGQRTIRTMLNEPYSFHTPGAIKEAGKDKVLQSLWDARTQHKDKTADQAFGLAEVVTEMWAESDDDGSLDACREQAGHDVEKERQWLKKSVKGLGDTGLDIFCRRVQWLWEELYPFVDKRTADALEELGLPKTAEDLRDLIASEWAALEIGDLGVEDEDQRKRRAFVLVLEKAVGASLEKGVEKVKREAAKST
ncbi:hypothetical protein JX265_011339 [Neoarthrinium moseri]|uniref:Uncharacterized protein n=1 Tax=Neoarthrinium moseri TaxID=1658444 RepID=A0A9P9WCW2_9PEZI|nr:hypothetical protein JX265_011339 [Neoarthrinium moseri]